MEKMLVHINGLNQLLYCEHRAFLMHACGEMEDNEHIWMGRKTHQRVDSGEVSQIKEKKIYRNIYISHEELGLVGIADSLEECCGEYFVVEYKKGQPQRNGFAWPNDSMQVEAQILCFEYMGVPVIGGCIYYGTTRKRVDVVKNSQSYENVCFYAERLRDIALGRIITKPSLGPRCSGCSLKNICLPELNLSTFGEYWREKHE